MASRLQSGDRTPGIDTMRKIAKVFEFSLDDQARARANGTYRKEFAAAIARYERKQEKQHAATA